MLALQRRQGAEEIAHEDMMKLRLACLHPAQGKQIRGLSYASPLPS